MAFQLSMSAPNTVGACNDASMEPTLANRISGLGLTDSRGYMANQSNSDVGTLWCYFQGSSTFSPGWAECGATDNSTFDLPSGETVASWAYSTTELVVP
jgi:hypothetical protein